MTKEDRKRALSYAIQQSKDGGLYYVLLNAVNTFITSDESLAKFYVHHYGYRVYAKCKDGYMIL